MCAKPLELPPHLRVVSTQPWGDEVYPDAPQQDSPPFTPLEALGRQEVWADIMATPPGNPATSWANGSESCETDRADTTARSIPAYVTRWSRCRRCKSYRETIKSSAGRFFCRFCWGLYTGGSFPVLREGNSRGDTIFLGGISKFVTANNLTIFLEAAFGPVRMIRLLTDLHKRPLTYCFVRFADVHTAQCVLRYRKLFFLERYMDVGPGYYVC